MTSKDQAPRRVGSLGVFVILAGFSLAGSSAGAHEFWMEPSNFRPAAGERVSFRLLVGDGFPGEGYARNPQHLVRFELIGPGSARPIVGRPGDDPAGSAVLDRPGRSVAVYRSVDTQLELEPQRFEHYLADAGLDRILALRKERGQSAEPGRELFSRCAKTVVAGPGVDNSGFDRVAGLALELVPEDDPLELLPGDVLPIRVLFEGQPLRGVLLRALRQGRREVLASARSDEQGRAQLKFDQYGLWMISAVHMIEAPEDSSADWQSVWTSLTLSIAP